MGIIFELPWKHHLACMQATFGFICQPSNANFSLSFLPEKMFRLTYWWWQETNLTNPTIHLYRPHNAPSCNRNMHKYAYFCNKMVHCGISLMHCWICVMVAAAARGSQDLTRRLTWGALGAKLNETTTLRPHISRTKWTDNMDFATRIQKNVLSQHVKSWYSRENIVLLSVVLTWHLGKCIPAKKRMPD